MPPCSNSDWSTSLGSLIMAGFERLDFACARDARQQQFHPQGYQEHSGHWSRWLLWSAAVLADADNITATISSTDLGKALSVGAAIDVFALGEIIASGISTIALISFLVAAECCCTQPSIYPREVSKAFLIGLSNFLSIIGASMAFARIDEPQTSLYYVGMAFVIASKVFYPFCLTLVETPHREPTGGDSSAAEMMTPRPA